MTTLNARNFDALPAMMDQTFGFAYWQSQGNSYPSDQAIEFIADGSDRHPGAERQPGSECIAGRLEPICHHGA